MNRLACALVLAGSVCLFAANPGDARAAPPSSKSDLELSIMTPDPGSIGDKITLDVSFRGSIIDAVELTVDGNLVAKRQISTPQPHGVISFTLDATQMTEGIHTVQVKAIGPNGKVATSAAKLKIPAIDLSAPVRISYPQNGVQVYGVVPIKVYMDGELQRQK